MKRSFKTWIGIFLLAFGLMFGAVMIANVATKASGTEVSSTEVALAEGDQNFAEAADNTIGFKAIGVGIAIGFAALGGGIGMGIVGGKTTESVARQPDMEGSIRTILMLDLVFIETAIIYALLAVILIIFVM